MDKAFFIDKDGTLVDNSGYPQKIPKSDLLESEIIQGLRDIQAKEYKIIIVSNQPWISKGRMTTQEVEEVFKDLKKKLQVYKINLDGYYYCPHQTSDNCKCKKPSGEMIMRAADEHKIDLTNSFMVGDAEKDIQAGKNASLKTILVLTGTGKNYKKTTEADYIIDNLNQVKDLI
jgi:D-glycero-D-manno-heptose 1,7-bisphosphate phosphatase